MSIAKMKLVTISSEMNRLDDVLKEFIEFENIHPIPSEQFVDSVHGAKTFSASNSVKALLDEVIEIEKEFDISLPEVKCEYQNYSVSQMHDDIVKIHQSLKNEVDEVKEIEKEIKTQKIALEQVYNLEDLDISLDDIFQCDFVTTRFGRLPVDSLEKIKYYRNKPFIFKSFKESENYSWCMYIVSEEYKREIDNIFSSLFFERIRIPDFVHGTPENAKKQLENHIAELENKINKLNKDFESLKQSYHAFLTSAKSELEFLNKISESKKYVVGLGERFTISGFVVKNDIEDFKNHFSKLENVELEIRPADSDKRITPPTKLKNNWFSKPFEMYVEMYGTPSYSDIDPTVFVSITYTLLFGMMFGDFGQGLALSLIGFLLWKFKKMPLGQIITRIGFSAAFFGLVYGSFFGNEEIIPKLFEKIGLKTFHVGASSNTMTLLLATVGVGSILILTAIAINIYVKFRNKHYASAVLSSSGIMGFVFYGFILGGIALQAAGIAKIINPVTIVLFIVIPIALIFLKEPIERKLKKEKAFPDGIGGFIIEGFFELFEVVLSYVTNTLSFLRVGGFVLAHYGLMTVVAVLMKMAGNGSLIVMIFGNLFVMGLEGLIVGIQVLRLEFYEMFSRYYEGDGVPFSPIKF